MSTSVYPDLQSRSAALSRRAHEVFPGGGTRGQTYYKPYPIYARSGQGCRVTDVDGTERIDFINNYTVQIFGHSHPEIVAAVKAQLDHGTCFTLPTESEIELAELICARAKSFERIRFTSTGSEAVMHAIKGARAYAGRPKIAKCEGVYHGGYDYAEVSLDPDPQSWGQDEPVAVGHTRGAPRGMLQDVVVLPFNDVATSKALLEKHADQLAGVLLDAVPSRCGGIPASPEYLDMVRDFTRKNGSVLILDEVVTWRLHHGGAQTLYGIEPDMTTLGKVIGGGLPIGAVVGRDEVMQVYDSSEGKALCSHSGTYTANPLSMVAGATALRMLTPEVIARLNTLGERARAALREALRLADVDGLVTGEGSLFLLHLSPDPLGDYRSTYRAHTDRRGADMESLFRRLLNQGVVLSTWGLGCLSTPMTEAEIDHLGEAVAICLRELREIERASAQS